MIGLTAMQQRACDHIVRQRAMGVEPTTADIASGVGLKARSSGHRLRELAVERLGGRKGLDRLVPRAPDGARLLLVPVPGLPMPWEQE
jgi:hypothetical protein